MIHTDGWKAYDGLIVNRYEHYRVFCCENEFAGGKPHVNGIESFWSYAKHRPAKFNACKSDKFVIRLMETEFRCNHRNEKLVKIIKKLMEN
jgi:transposase-like protein